MFQLVITNRTTYLCENTEEKDGRLILSNACDIPPNSYNDAEMAQLYIRNKIKGVLIPIRVSLANVESQRDMEEVSSILTTYIAQIPLAEKRAKASAIIAEMNKIMGNAEDDD